MAEPAVPVSPNSVQGDPLFETDEEFEFDPSENDSSVVSDWEDVLLAADSPKADEKPLFQRVDSKQDLASAKSLLTAMLSGSVPPAPVPIGGSKRQSGKQHFRTPEQKALSPTSTRMNMLASELSVSLRQNLLWERQQKIRVLPIVPKPARQGNGLGIIAVKNERSNSF